MRDWFWKYDLYFESIHASAFDTNWIIGVINAPFDPDNLETPVPCRQETKLVYWIQFVPRLEETGWLSGVYSKLGGLTMNPVSALLDLLTGCAK